MIDMANAGFRVLPGFGLTLGYTTFYLSLMVLIPLGAAVLKAASLTPSQFWRIVTTPEALAAYRVTFGASLIAASINALLGLLIAWVLVRYHFPGKAIVDALIDLPFALPTAVAGLIYAILYSPTGWLGQFLPALGIDVRESLILIVLVLVFTGFPFVVRTVQPVLESLEPELEESALTLGATRWQTFSRVVLPLLLPAVLTGFALAFARALGEYGSVIFVSTNIPGKTKIAPMLIFEKLDAYQYAHATAIAVVLLAASFVLLGIINLSERWSRRYAR